MTNINSNRNTTFIEGNRNIDFVFLGEEHSKNNTLINYFHVKRGNNNLFNLTFKKSEIESNKEIITESRLKENESILGQKNNFLPFADGSDVKLVKVNKNIKKVSLGTAQDEFDLKVFKESSFDLKEVVLENLTIIKSQNQIYYPFSFNYYKFLNSSGKIDVYSNIAKIQNTSSEVDKIKGFKSSAYKYSKNAFGDNNQLAQNYVKKENKVYHFEDSIIESILYSDIDKMMIDGIIHTINPQTLQENKQYQYRKINTFTKEVRFFAYKECNILPFSDVDFKSNDWSLTKNRFALTSNEINNKIKEQTNLNKKINEKIIFASHGKDCDLSLSNGRESLAFFGVQN